MRPNPPNGAHGFYIPVLADIKVIAASVESPAAVGRLKVVPVKQRSARVAEQ